MDVAKLIDDAYDNDAADTPRRYIGASIIGSDCSAYLELSLRGFPDDRIEPRLRRIFRDGHRIEDSVVADLKKAGVDILEKDPMTGKQWEFSSYGGHFAGHADGLIQNMPGDGMVEIKSMKEKKWDEFKEYGVKTSHPGYYAQMQAMMGLSGFNKTLFVAYNKNTSAYHSEIVKFDTFYYSSLRLRVECVLNGVAKRISDDPKSWRCNGCFKFKACWENAPAPTTCQTCKHSFPSMSGGKKWVCRLSSMECLAPCPKWERHQVRPA